MTAASSLFGLAGTLPGGLSLAEALAEAMAEDALGFPGARLLIVPGSWPEIPDRLLEECGLAGLLAGDPLRLYRRALAGAGLDGKAPESLPDIEGLRVPEAARVLASFLLGLPLRRGPVKDGPSPKPREAKTRIALVGPMAVGKTALGRVLAGSLGLPFVDADEAIVEAAGMDIPSIFATQGEGAFRLLEAKVIASLLEGQALVLATGGGAVLDPRSRALLSSRARVVWLHAPASVLAARARLGPPRPLLAGLSGADQEARLAGIYEERLPFYAQIADFLLPIGGRSPQVLAEVLHDALSTPSAPGR